MTAGHESARLIFETGADSIRVCYPIILQVSFSLCERAGCTFLDTISCIRIDSDTLG